jgi:uncharacterized protein
MSDAPSERTRVHRLAKRASYDAADIHAILDEGLICHVAWTDEDGGPRMLPSIHARVGDTLYLHGSRAGRPWKHLASGAEVAVAVTVVDGLVLARSAFNHSMNYRSVVIFGAAREVTDPEELHVASRAITRHIAPGREDDTRMPTEDEYRQTLLLAVPIDEASAKIRTGPPGDNEEAGAPYWAGVVPLSLQAGAPIPAPDMPTPIPTPGYATHWRRPAD